MLSSCSLILSFCFFKLYGAHRDLHVLTHSFPTRRSSDLRTFSVLSNPVSREGAVRMSSDCSARCALNRKLSAMTVIFCGSTILRSRSEEHTSELQSLMRISYAVFCLKKKNNKDRNAYTEQNEQ